MNQDKAGIKLLNELIGEAPLFRSEALYYISLSHIKSGKVDLAKTTLSQIEHKSSKYLKAQELLKKLAE